LYYLGARYYSPVDGIFLSVDPLAGSFPSWGPYVYTLNNPVRLTDPTGMAPEGGEGDIYNNKGVHIGNDGVNDDRAYHKDTDSDKTLTTAESKSAIANGSASLLNISNSELNLRSFLSSLRSTENLPQETPLGYNAQYGGGGPGGTFTENSYDECPESYCEHPLLNANVNGGTPAGAYQFTRATWMDLVNRRGLSSEFFPVNQDQGASMLVKPSAKDYLSTNQIAKAVNIAKSTWSSLPGGKHSKISLTGFVELFNSYRAKEMSGNTILATPQGQLR
jgi:muramidase (phage lysozyme)